MIYIKSMLLTVSQARILEADGFKLELLDVRAGKDFYSVYVVA